MITTKNTNPRNDSQWARHRSIEKDGQEQLQEVLEALRRQPHVTRKRLHGTYSNVRTGWDLYFKQQLPQAAQALSKPGDFRGYAGLDTWLPQQFHHDLGIIFLDFARVWVRRVRDKNPAELLLFVSYTPNDFDMIFSKWGYDAGQGKRSHKFFHWHSTVRVVARPTIDEFADPDDGAGDDDI